MEGGPMKELFKDIVRSDGVLGVVLAGPDGSILFQSLEGGGQPFDIQKLDFQKLTSLLGKLREADLVFQKGRIYVRKAEIGLIVIVLEPVASLAMVKLNCDILLPQLKAEKAGKARKGFFRKG
jgi:hypothetical protein